MCRVYLNLTSLPVLAAPKSACPPPQVLLDRAKAEEAAYSAFASGRSPAAVLSALTSGKSVGLEFQGDGCEADVRRAAEEHGGMFVPGKDGGIEYRFAGIDG